MGATAKAALLPDRRTAALHMTGVIAASALVFVSLSPRALPGSDPVLLAAMTLRMPLLLLLASVSLRRLGLDWAAVGLRWPGWKRTLGVSLGGYVLLALVVAPVRLGLRAAHLAPDYAAFAVLQGNALLFWLWALPMAVVSGAICEELLFRGYLRHLCRVLLAREGRAAEAVVIVLQAAIFGALHAYQGPGGMILAFAGGVVLGAVYLLGKRSLAPGMIVHGVTNVASLTAFYLALVPQGGGGI